MPLNLESAELQTALEAARRAAQICTTVYGQLVEEANKSGREPVTIADYASQTIINATLRAVFPHDRIMGEEHAADFEKVLTPPQQQQVSDFAAQGLNRPLTEAEAVQILGDTQGNSGRTWIIDPIDGTKGFLAKRAYAIAIALMDADGLQLGVLACPNLSLTNVGELSADGVLFYAVRGGGAYHEPLAGGERIPMQVIQPPDDQPLYILSSVESGHSNQDLFGTVFGSLPHPDKHKIGLDGQGKYGLVANGSAGAYFRLVPEADYREKVWDHAAGAIIVEEAGGQVTDFDGHPLDFASGHKMVNNRGVVVSNGVLHPHLLAAIARQG